MADGVQAIRHHTLATGIKDQLATALNVFVDVTLSSLALVVHLGRERGINWTHCGLVTPWGDINLGQHWLRWWLGAWRHQAITWTNADLSWGKSTNIHLQAFSHEIPQPPIIKISLKIMYLKFYSNLPGGSELITTLRPEQNCAISQVSFVNDFSWIMIDLNFTEGSKWQEISTGSRNGLVQQVDTKPLLSQNWQRSISHMALRGHELTFCMLKFFPCICTLYHTLTQRCHRFLRFILEEDNDISFCRVNIMASDNLVMLGAMASGAMIYEKLSGIVT